MAIVSNMTRRQERLRSRPLGKTEDFATAANQASITKLARISKLGEKKATQTAKTAGMITGQGPAAVVTPPTAPPAVTPQAVTATLVPSQAPPNGPNRGGPLSLGGPGEGGQDTSGMIGFDDTALGQTPTGQEIIGVLSKGAMAFADAVGFGLPSAVVGLGSKGPASMLGPIGSLAGKATAIPGAGMVGGLIGNALAPDAVSPAPLGTQGPMSFAEAVPGSVGGGGFGGGRVSPTSGTQGPMSFAEAVPGSMGKGAFSGSIGAIGDSIGPWSGGGSTGPFGGVSGGSPGNAGGVAVGSMGGGEGGFDGSAGAGVGGTK